MEGSKKTQKKKTAAENRTQALITAAVDKALATQQQLNIQQQFNNDMNLLSTESSAAHHFQTAFTIYTDSNNCMEGQEKAYADVKKLLSFTDKEDMALLLEDGCRGAFDTFQNTLTMKARLLLVKALKLAVSTPVTTAPTGTANIKVDKVDKVLIDTKAMAPATIKGKLTVASITDNNYDDDDDDDDPQNPLSVYHHICAKESQPSILEHFIRWTGQGSKF